MSSVRGHPFRVHGGRYRYPGDVARLLASGLLLAERSNGRLHLDPSP
jgi:hypothetical protein